VLSRLVNQPTLVPPAAVAQPPEASGQSAR
jgi:hypothetical protein